MIMHESERLNEPEEIDAIDHTTMIVANYVLYNKIAVEELPDLIRSVSAAVKEIQHAQRLGISAKSAPPAIPAIDIKASITPDYLVCLEDGKKLKLLKRYLRARHDMSPEEYRRKWGLPDDYPMVAPNYAKKRSTLAKEFRLGRK